MPVADKYTVDFLENETYHVYNRTNNREKLFLSSDNYLFFLKKYDHYLSPFCQTYAWCLLPNHFHLLIRIKPSTEIKRLLTLMDLNQVPETDRKFMKGEITVGELVEHTFKRFFQSYALAFNKVNNRKGNLFYQSFRRILVEKESQFTSNITYIHLNPVKHGLTDDFTKVEMVIVSYCHIRFTYQGVKTRGY